MRCPYCSNEIEDEAIICRHCSSAVMDPARSGIAEARQESPIMEQLRPEEVEELLEELDGEGAELRPEKASPPPSDEAVQRLERAFALEDEGEYDKALEECHTAIRLDPTLADAHNLRGVILEELAWEEEAVLAYREALRLDPDFDAARENLNAVEAELAAEKARREAHTADGFISSEETMEESAEEPILFEPQKGDSAYVWLSGCVDLLPVAEAITVYEYPNAGLTITIPISEITSCEIVEREDIPHLRRGWSDRESGSNLGCLLVAEFITLFDRAVANATMVPVIKLTQSTSDDSGHGWVIHLRSDRRGRGGQVATFELAQRIVTLFHRSGYDGAIPEELSVPTDLGTWQKSKWIVGGFLASFLSYVAGVLVCGYLFEPWNLSFPEYLNMVSDMYLGLSSCCSLPGLALSLFAISLVVLRSISAKRSAVAIIIMFAIINLVIGCGVGLFMMLDLSRY